LGSPLYGGDHRNRRSRPRSGLREQQRLELRRGAVSGGTFVVDKLGVGKYHGERGRL
jgi:hypothetical protein